MDSVISNNSDGNDSRGLMSYNQHAMPSPYVRCYDMISDQFRVSFNLPWPYFQSMPKQSDINNFRIWICYQLTSFQNSIKLFYSLCSSFFFFFFLVLEGLLGSKWLNQFNTFKFNISTMAFQKGGEEKRGNEFYPRPELQCRSSFFIKWFQKSKEMSAMLYHHEDHQHIS